MAPDKEIIMGSQRGSASVTESQIEKGEKVFRKQAQQRAKSPTSRIEGRGTGGRLGVGGRGGGGGGGGGGKGPRPGPAPIPDHPKPKPGPGGPPGGTPLRQCRHRGCKCGVALPAQYCKKYCADAAESGSRERCRCNHDECK